MQYDSSVSGWVNGPTMITPGQSRGGSSAPSGGGRGGATAPTPSGPRGTASTLPGMINAIEVQIPGNSIQRGLTWQEAQHQWDLQNQPQQWNPGQPAQPQQGYQIPGQPWGQGCDSIDQTVNRLTKQIQALQNMAKVLVKRANNLRTAGFPSMHINARRGLYRSATKAANRAQQLTAQINAAKAAWQQRCQNSYAPPYYYPPQQGVYGPQQQWQPPAAYAEQYAPQSYAIHDVPGYVDPAVEARYQQSIQRLLADAFAGNPDGDAQGDLASAYGGCAPCGFGQLGSRAAQTDGDTSGDLASAFGRRRRRSRSRRGRDSANKKQKINEVRMDKSTYASARVKVKADDAQAAGNKAEGLFDDANFPAQIPYLVSEHPTNKGVWLVRAKRWGADFGGHPNNMNNIDAVIPF